jgi:hypothetical protein
MCSALSPTSPLSRIWPCVPTRNTTPSRTARPLPLSARPPAASEKSSAVWKLGACVPRPKTGTRLKAAKSEVRAKPFSRATPVSPKIRGLEPSTTGLRGSRTSTRTSPPSEASAPSATYARPSRSATSAARDTSSGRVCTEPARTGADGSLTSTTCTPPLPSATTAMLPSTATPRALPGVSSWPTIQGAAGSETSTIVRPACPSAT